MMDVISVFWVVMLIGFVVRWIPHRIAPGGLGVDHWYWKLYLETYQLEKKFPPVLSQYLLDEHQWYPPLFIMLLAKLPQTVFKSYSHYVGITVDLARLVLVMSVAGWWSAGNPLVIGIAGGVYAFTPIVISYNIQLNPRGLAAFFLDLQFLLTFQLIFRDGTLWLWLIVLFLGALILLTHKMTTQLMFFLVLIATLVTREWQLFAIVPGSMIVAWIISRGFYWKVLLAHWDIVSFWYRNWIWLMAHPIKSSPIYGNKNYKSPTQFYGHGYKTFLKHLQYFLAYNPFAWLALLVLSMHVEVFSTIEIVLYFLLAGTLLFGVLTIAVPQMRCFGSGYLYVFNTALPASLLFGVELGKKTAELPILCGITVASVLSIVAIIKFYKNVQNSQILKVDQDFEKLIYWLSNAKKGTVMSLPLVWSDVIAFKTGQPVLCGGHGYGFKYFETICPRILVPVSQFKKDYMLKYVVARNGYLNEAFLNDLEYEDMISFGPYRLYVLSN